MKICFIADMNSIHVKRIISYFVREKDDILILSSAPKAASVPGARTVHLLGSYLPFLAPASGEEKRPPTLRTPVKSFIPRSLKVLINRTKRNLHLFSKRAYCRAEIQRFASEVIYGFRCFPEGMLAALCHVPPLVLRTAGEVTKLIRQPAYIGSLRDKLCALLMPW